MGRPHPVTSRRQSIPRQAASRLLFSLALFVVLLGYGSYRLYSITLHKSAHERADYLVTYYRTRLIQLDRDWEFQARDLKVRIEDTHLLESRNSGTNLQAYLTIHDASKRFQYLLIQDRQGNKLFDFGANLGLAAIPAAANEDNGWYHPDNDGTLYRMFIVPVWLGKGGMGRMAVFYELNNALLFNMATPGITLTAKHDGLAFASSSGQKRLDLAQPPRPDMEYTDERDIPWEANKDDSTFLSINAPVKPLFTKAELTASAAAIPVIYALILLSSLGFWLMRNARRIRSLGEAVEEFAVQRQPTPALQRKLDRANDQREDEISEVSVALKDMINQTLVRERERQQEEAQRRL